MCTPTIPIFSLARLSEFKKGLKIVHQHTATFTSPKTCKTGKTFSLNSGDDGCNLKNGKSRPAFTAVSIKSVNGQKSLMYSLKLGVSGMKELEMKMSYSISAQKAQQDQKKHAKVNKEAGKEETKYETTAKTPAATKPPSVIKKPTLVDKKPNETAKPVKVEYM